CQSERPEEFPVGAGGTGGVSLVASCAEVFGREPLLETLLAAEGIRVQEGLEADVGAVVGAILRGLEQEAKERLKVHLVLVDLLQDFLTITSGVRWNHRCASSCQLQRLVRMGLIEVLYLQLGGFERHLRDCGRRLQNGFDWKCQGGGNVQVDGVTSLFDSINVFVDHGYRVGALSQKTRGSCNGEQQRNLYMHILILLVHEHDEHEIEDVGRVRGM
ncbi:hypothetical protein MBANPS3_012477, partial [Mucor bainieri]